MLFGIRSVRANSSVVAGGKAAKPGLLQRNVLWRETRDGFDDQQVPKLFGRRAVGEQQMTDIVVRDRIRPGSRNRRRS